MPLRLTVLENILARLNMLPMPLLDSPLAVGTAKALVTACEIDLFDTLGKGSSTAVELAQKSGCDPQGLQLLLNLLVSAGYLRVQKSKYRNTAMTRRWLLSTSSVSIAPYVIHSPDIIAIWDRMPEVVRTNKQAMHMPYAEDASNSETAQLLARHYAGLASLATSLGGEIVNRVSLPRGATQLLDVGGSHAGYSALFCRKYRRLHATVLDIEAGIQAGQRTAKIMKLESCMCFTSTDIVQDDFSQQFAEQFDVALYFHIAHLLQPEVNQATLTKVAKTLKPGGMLIYLDQVTDQTHGSRLASLMVQFMALTVTTIGGTCYPFPTVKSWLEHADMGQVKRHRLLTPGATLVTAIK